MVDKNLLVNAKKAKDFINKIPCSDDTNISLIYLIQGLFPKAEQKFKENLEKKYISGYIDGRKDALNGN
jgi:hypothetical protein